MIPSEAIAHAERDYPREACGLILCGGQYFPCRNAASTPSEHFVISPADYRAALAIAEPAAVFHSHPDYKPAPSEADLSGCEESGIPWLILEVRDGKAGGWTRTEPSGWQAPLIGRQFTHGVHDCLTIILDFYKREMGIDLGHYERRDNWWNEGGDLYREHLPAAGFRLMPAGTELEHGDVVLMQIRSPVPNHAGVFLADGLLKSEQVPHPAPCSILHHLYGRLSRRDPYGGYYLEKTVSVWRYGKT